MNCGTHSDDKVCRLRWILWMTDGRNCFLWFVCRLELVKNGQKIEAKITKVVKLLSIMRVVQKSWNIYLFFNVSYILQTTRLTRFLKKKSISGPFSFRVEHQSCWCSLSMKIKPALMTNYGSDKVAGRKPRWWNQATVFFCFSHSLPDKLSHSQEIHNLW